MDVSDSVYRVARQTNGTSISFMLELAALPSLYRKTWTLSEEDFTEYVTLLQEEHSFGAYDSDRLIGMVLCSERRWYNTLHIENILIAASHRSKGIGGSLVKQVIAHGTLEKFRSVNLETQNTNVPAIRFYQQLSLIIDGLQMGLCDPEDIEGEIAIFMAYTIVPAQPRPTSINSVNYKVPIDCYSH